MKLETTPVRLKTPPDFHRLLMPRYFTPASLLALQYDGALVERCGGATYLLHVVDGQWRPDSKAPETVPNPFGGLNSIRRVGNGD